MTIQIIVEEDVQELIRQRIESGAFRNVSDVVAHALRNSDASEHSDSSPRKKNFYDFIRESPLMGSGIKLERIKDYPREIDFG